VGPTAAEVAVMVVVAAEVTAVVAMAVEKRVVV